jgi:hypothetical protein
MRANPELLDRCWSWLAMALVGEELDERDEICGAGLPREILAVNCELTSVTNSCVGTSQDRQDPIMDPIEGRC